MNSDNNNNNKNDGFTLVKSKRKTNKTINKFNNNNNSSNMQMKQQQQQHIKNESLLIVDKEYVLTLNKKILEYKQKLIDYDTCFYWSKLQISLRTILNEYFFSINNKKKNNNNDNPDHQQINYNNNNNNRINLICYGLGSIDDNLSSRYQLALFLLIIDEINSFSSLNHNNNMNMNNENNNNNKKINIDLIEFYDPVFNLNDKSLLTDLLQFKLAETNECCFKNVTPLNNNESTKEKEGMMKTLNLFYMPHCSKGMYNNLLASNWSQHTLSTLVILGNSFQTITTNNLDSKLLKNYSYILDSLQFLNESFVNSECDLTNAFTDLTIHMFAVGVGDNLKLVNNLVDNENDLLLLKRPIYDNENEDCNQDNEEIIS